VWTKPVLLRRNARRGFSGRLAGLCLLVPLLVAAPSANGLPSDETPPVITISIFGTLGLNGWYRTNVTVNWHITEPDGPFQSNCQFATTLTVDTPGTELTCEATSDGGTASVRKTFKIDKTPPTVAAGATRLPDANGWYNHVLTVSFTGADATSGLAGCDATNYGGPDNAAASVAGTCRDMAGNVSPSAWNFKYDATPPTLSAVSTKRGNQSAQLIWHASSDTQRVEIARAPGRNGAGSSVVYQGAASSYTDSNLTVGRNYRYRITGFDAASNRVDQTVTLTASGRLLSPSPGEKVTASAPPTLTWTPVKKASYYNLQLIRGRKVLSVWPARANFRLPRAWSYLGRRYRLRPGVYRWYVWPGRGPRSENRYGDLLGSSSFVVSG
jgi:hypothetical protein